MMILYEEEFYDISICQRYINLSTMFRLHEGLERNTLKGIFIGISLLKSITVPFSRREKKRKIPIFKSLTYRWGLEMQLTNVHCCIYYTYCEVFFHVRPILLIGTTGKFDHLATKHCESPIKVKRFSDHYFLNKFAVFGPLALLRFSSRFYGGGKLPLKFQEPR